MIIEFIKLIICSILIVLISKYILATTLRKLAESMNLKAKIVGNISGIATSIPEFLTVIISGVSGLIETSIFNILSSNIINCLQYTGSIIINKNIKLLRNKVIKVELFFVIITILIPILISVTNIEINLFLVISFIFLFFILFLFDNKLHKKILNEEIIISKKEEEKILKEKDNSSGNVRNNITNVIILIITGGLLYIVGNILSNSLEVLCNNFNVSQIVIGILLGFVTSIPEFITFFESQKYYKKDEAFLGVVEATNNLLSSNMINLFIIQSIAMFIYICN